MKIKHGARLTALIAALAVLTVQISAQTLSVTKSAVLPCGKQPKQVLFTPDGKAVVLPLLDDTGFEVITLSAAGEPAQTETPASRSVVRPPHAERKGFAEGLFVPEKGAFFISQMTTGYVYEYAYPGFTLRREIPVGGEWCKFIAWDGTRQRLAVSNWISNTVSIIDYESGKTVKTVRTAAAPRGLAFTENGNTLIVTCFDGGVVQKIHVESGTETARIGVPKSAMRHIAVTADETRAYVSDMYHAAVYEIDLAAFTVTDTYRVFNNPNTICLYKDRYLFVSSRGPNDPVDYTRRSPVNGKITVIDTAAKTVLAAIDGGNQPTGLSVAPDGSSFCFSNFQDANVELYRIRFAE